MAEIRPALFAGPIERHVSFRIASASGDGADVDVGALCAATEEAMHATALHAGNARILLASGMTNVGGRRTKETPANSPGQGLESWVMEDGRWANGKRR